MKVYSSIESLLEREFDGEGCVHKCSNIELVYVNKQVRRVLDYYNCPNCGLVNEEPYKRVKENRTCSTGRYKLYEYFCKICESTIHSSAEKNPCLD